jgi:hypothetical protein
MVLAVSVEGSNSKPIFRAGQIRGPDEWITLDVYLAHIRIIRGENLCQTIASF